MVLLIDATYKDGSLVLDKKLKKSNENKKMKVLILDNDEIATEEKKGAFFSFIKSNSFDLPENYKITREEMNER